MAIALKEARPVTGEEIIVECPDGKRLNVVPHPQPIFDTDGRLCGAMNMLVDVTAEREKEKALLKSERAYRLLSEDLEKIIENRTNTLKKSEERYHKMIDEVQDYAIILLDIYGNIQNWNRGAENIKGYTEQEIIGRNFSIFYRKEDNDVQLPQKLIAEASVKGKAMHEGWRVRKNGTMFWGYIVITALHDDQGNIIGYSKVTRDLTEKKQADDQLREYAHDIEFRNKQLEEFAYIASHDLQEPLRKIQTFADMLQIRIDDKEAVVANAEKIRLAAQRMSVLIKDVLKYSQLSTTENLFEDTDLNSVFNEVKGDFELLIQEKDAHLTASQLPVIKGIPIQMHQLFANLISNAVKFSDRQPNIGITAQYVSGEALNDISVPDPKQQYVKLSFQDNGIGFEPQYADHVFKLFKRLNSFKSGTGIGLALCKKIVENHAGAITVSSEPGVGTLFEIYLPV
jgi:PAS domain S-box-containing protein